tara:strand:+ start:35 stop:820 length:786 start_codon:yes stop_codon:yes gene_type:complete
MVTGEQYVGQTITLLSSRVHGHKAAAKKPKFKINFAIANYGFDNFSFAEVFIAFDRAALNYAEKQVIKDLNPIYNMSSGGAGSSGRIRSAGEKSILSEHMKIKWADPLWRANTTAAITASCQNEDAVIRGKKVGTLYGGRARWAGYAKKVRVAKERGVGMKAAWGNPVTRAKITAGIVLAFNKPEVRARCSLSAIGRKHSIVSVEKIARTKWKPLYCKELQCSFQSQKHAAEYFGVCTSAVSQAIANKGRVQYKYTLTRVA